LVPTGGFLCKSFSGAWQKFCTRRSRVLGDIIPLGCSSDVRCVPVSASDVCVVASYPHRIRMLTYRNPHTVLESGFLPGSLYTLSRWYSRSELAKRSVIFFYGNTLSAAFGSLLYAGCLKLDNHLGVKAWQWYGCNVAVDNYILRLTIFLSIGFLSSAAHRQLVSLVLSYDTATKLTPQCLVAAGLLALLLIPSSPRKSAWLTEREADIFVARLTLDDPLQGHASTMKIAWSDM
jgi:hypothetical protein